MDFIYKAFGAMLGFFTTYMSGGNYAIALIFYALVFKIVFLPFAIKQQKNQIKMAKLTPKIQLIKAKYKGRTDQATLRKQQEEIAQLQQAEGYSPLSGCLPLLLQFPIIIWLYQVIRMPLTYISNWSDATVAWHFQLLGQEVNLKNGQIGLISELINRAKEFAIPEHTVESLPNFRLFTIDLGVNPFDGLKSGTKLWVLIFIPILVGVFQWLQMFITRKLNGNVNALAGEQDAQSNLSMKIMDIVMPLFTVVMAFTFPALMGLYWMYQSILAIIQTVIIAKAMPLPRYTEEQLKAMKKEQKAIEKEQKNLIKQQPKYRSLHYIDEEDYDTLPTVKKKDGKEENTKSKTNMDIPEIKD